MRVKSGLCVWPISEAVEMVLVSAFHANFAALPLLASSMKSRLSGIHTGQRDPEFRRGT